MKDYNGYSVLIKSDSGKSGTGILYCEKDSENFYIITCAHVVINTSQLKICILQPDSIEGEKEIYIDVDSNNIYYPPYLEDDELKNSEMPYLYDAAIIECKKGNINMDLKATSYCLSSPKELDLLTVVGYPSSISDERIYFQQINLSAQTDKVSINDNKFIIKIIGDELNDSDRYDELKGFSGSPLWEKEELVKNNHFLCGMVLSGIDFNIKLRRINALSTKVIHTFMRETLGISIEFRLPNIPDSDIAPRCDVINHDIISVRSSWIENEHRKAYYNIETLQLEKATEICKHTIQNSEFSECNNEQKYSIFKLLLEAYRV